MPFELNTDSPQAAGLIAWWPTLASRGMNKLRDMGGRGLDGTFNGGLTWGADGTMGAALTFNGTSGFVSIASMPTLSGIMSMSCWFNSATVTAGARYMGGDCNVLGDTFQYILSLNNSAAKVTFQWSGAYTLTGVATLNANTWYHVLATRTGVAGAWTARIYINGLLDKQGTTATNPPAAQLVSLGRPGGYNGLYWNGALANVRLRNIAVPASIAWQEWDPATRWDLYAPIRRWWAVGVSGGMPPALLQQVKDAM